MLRLCRVAVGSVHDAQHDALKKRALSTYLETLGTVRRGGAFDMTKCLSILRANAVDAASANAYVQPLLDSMSLQNSSPQLVNDYRAALEEIAANRAAIGSYQQSVTDSRDANSALLSVIAGTSKGSDMFSVAQFYVYSFGPDVSALKHAFK